MSKIASTLVVATLLKRVSLGLRASRSTRVRGLMLSLGEHLSEHHELRKPYHEGFEVTRCITEMDLERLHTASSKSG